MRKAYEDALRQYGATEPGNVKVRKIWTLKKNAVIILYFELCGFTME